MTQVFKVGFTGTSKGMLPEQIAEVKEILARIKHEHADMICEFHHGLCIGADQQAAEIAKDLGFRIVAHPGFNPRNPEGTLYRSEFQGNDEMREAKPFIKRDHDIVDETEILIAAPLTRLEQVRSGTWTTVRYAKPKNKIIVIAYPSLPVVAPTPVFPEPSRTNAIAGEAPLVGPTHRQRGIR